MFFLLYVLLVMFSFVSLVSISFFALCVAPDGLRSAVGHSTFAYDI